MLLLQMGAHKHQLKVVNGDALRTVLRAVLDRFGSQRKAATPLGIGQPSFQKLLTGKTHKRIRADTFRRLLGVVRGDLPGHDQLEELLRSSVLTETGAHLSRLYGDWLRKSEQRLSPHGRSVFRALYRHPDYRPLFDDFLQKVTGRAEVPTSGSVEDRRVRFALLRVVEPLAEAERTWGVERSWRELHKARRLRAFVQYGLMRERQLLALRGRYLHRINDLADSHAFHEYLLNTEVHIPDAGKVDVAEAFDADDGGTGGTPAT